MGFKMSIKENLELLSKIEDVVDSELKKGFIDTTATSGQADHSDTAHNPKVRAVAENYAKQKGIKLEHPTEKTKVDPQHSAKIAQAYHSMKHDPNHPDVKAAYGALINETKDQFQHMKNAGLKITPIKSGQSNPYPNSKAMHDDIRHNNHLYFFPTDQGFGSGDSNPTDHPMLQPTGEHVDGHHLMANDLFRVVHDYFGHAKEGTGFGPHGEESAWKEHSKMFSPLAQKALTTETRGQNSWVNFGPHGESNRKNPNQTVYADQKAGLMPDWTHKPVSGLGKSEEYEELEKGSLQRRHKFNPKAPENKRVTDIQRDWTHESDSGIDLQEARDSIPKMEGNAKFRSLRKLAGQTHVRKHPQTGENLYLMHRGMGSEEFGGANKNGKTTHAAGEKTSWTPDREVASSFGTINDLEGNSAVVSAWIPESALSHSINQFNAPTDTALDNAKYLPKSGKKDIKGSRSITEREEKEWIVEHGPEGFHHANLDALAPHKADTKINQKQGKSGDKASYKAKDLKQIKPRDTHQGQFGWAPKEKLAASEKVNNSLRKDEEMPEEPKKSKGAKQEEEKVGEALSNLATDKQTTAGMNSRIYSMPSADKMKRSKMAGKTGQIPSSINIYGAHYPVVRLMDDNKTLLVHTSPYGQDGKTEELIEKIGMQLPEHFPDAHVIEIHHPDYRHSARIMKMRNPNTIADYLKHASENHPDENYRKHAAEAHLHLTNLNKIKKGEFTKPIHAKRTTSEGFDYEKNVKGRVDRLHNYLTSLGLTPDVQDDESGRDLGSKSPTSLTINRQGDPHDQQVLHEAGHALLTPPGMELPEYQNRIGAPGFLGKLKQTQTSSELKPMHGGGMPEQTAQHMEGLIARRAGIEPFRTPKRGKDGTSEELAREHAKQTVSDLDQGFYRFDPFSGEKELQANPNTLINAKSHKDSGLFGKIRRQLIEQRKTRASMSKEDLEDMAASEKDVSKPFGQHPRNWYKDKKSQEKRKIIAEKDRQKTGAKKPLDSAMDKLKDFNKAEAPKPLKTGDRVNHKTHGVGTVRQSHGDGHYTVGFDNSKDTSLNYKGLKVHSNDFNKPQIKKSSVASSPLVPEQLEGSLQKPFKSKKKGKASSDEIQKWEGKALKSGVLALALAHGAHYMNQDNIEAAKAPASREVAAVPVDPAQQAREAGRAEAEADVAQIMQRNFVKRNPYKPSHIAMKETIKSNPDLMNKYGYALKMSKPALSELVQSHPTMGQEVGEAHYSKLNQEFDGDSEKIDHAWRNGIKATKIKFGMENQ